MINYFTIFPLFLLRNKSCRYKGRKKDIQSTKKVPLGVVLVLFLIQ